MYTKICSKCGWKYPYNWPGRTCRFCHGEIKNGYCSRCGEWSEKLFQGVCTNCKTEKHKLWRDKRRATHNSDFEDWLAKIAKIPKPYTTLTEEQWLEACKHFGGCAYCGSPDISARSMFIAFKDGGRYCNWNIVPSCEICEAAYKGYTNPFLRMDTAFFKNFDATGTRKKQTQERLNIITAYLQSKMEGGK